MKIIPTCEVYKFSNISKFKLIAKKTYEKKYKQIYSDEGIFIIDNSSIKKLNIKDNKIQKININNKNFIIDNSIVKLSEEFRTPFSYNLLDITENEYKILPGDKITYIEKIVDNKLFDNYFYTKNNEIDSIIFNEIIDYLNYLN